MKQLILACALLGSIAAYADPHARQPPTPDARAVELQKVLQLSDEQTGKVKKVFESGAQQRKAVRDKYKPQFDAFHADMKQQHDATHAQLQAILTPKQQQALEALHAKHRGKGRGEHGSMRGHDHAAPDRPAHP